MVKSLVKLPGGGGEWTTHPLCERGLFTTTGVAHFRRKGRRSNLRARLGAFHKAKDNALQSATLICTTNPECIGVDFVKYVSLKEYGLGELLMLEVTIQWHCRGREEEEKVNRGDLRATGKRRGHP